MDTRNFLKYFLNGWGVDLIFCFYIIVYLTISIFYVFLINFHHFPWSISFLFFWNVLWHLDSPFFSISLPFPHHRLTACDDLLFSTFSFLTWPFLCFFSFSNILQSNGKNSIVFNASFLGHANFLKCF